MHFPRNAFALFAFALVLALLLSGCVQSQKTADKTGSDSGPAQESAAEKPAIQENVSPSAEMPEQPAVEGVVPAASDANNDETGMQQPVVVEQPAPETKEFSILADDHKFDPSTISVSKGETVKITFNFNDAEIYYGGLDIKSDYFTTKYRKSDSEKTKTAEFVADKSFSFTSYWPSSGVKKATGKVEVTGQ